MRKNFTKKVAQTMFVMMLAVGFVRPAVAAPTETFTNSDAFDMDIRNLTESFSESSGNTLMQPQDNTGTVAVSSAISEVEHNAVINPSVLQETSKDTSKKLDVFQKLLEFIAHEEKPVTGIIIDARGYNLEGTFSPLIYDEAGNIIYGKDNVDKEKAISQGLVEYAVDLEADFKSFRAGSSPLVLNAIAARDGCNSVNRVNVVVSMADAERIRKAEAENGVLTKMAVVFVR